MNLPSLIAANVLVVSDFELPPFFFLISFTISSFYEFRLDDSALFVVFELKLFLRRCAAFFSFVCTCLLLAGFFLFFYFFFFILSFFFCVCVCALESLPLFAWRQR